MLLASMNRSVLVAVLWMLGGCAHRAHVTGLDSNPTARIDAATFSRTGEEVIVEVQVGLSGQAGPQILVRTQLPCRAGPVPPPPGFSMVYLTFDPPTRSSLTADEGFITVHRCDEKLLELSGGWRVRGTLATALELPHQPPNPPIPVTHVELTHVTASRLDEKTP